MLGDVVGIRAEFCTEKEGSEGFEDRRGRRAQPGWRAEVVGSKGGCQIGTRAQCIWSENHGWISSLGIYRYSCYVIQSVNNGYC